MIDAFIRDELEKKLRSLPSYKHCIRTYLTSQSNKTILCAITYEKLEVTVCMVDTDFYVIAYKNRLTFKKWADTTDNIFNIQEIVSKTLESL